MNEPQLHTGYATIYGLFNASGECEYIGQTVYGYTRKTAHFKKWPELTFRELGKVLCEIASVTEKALITHYKALGQCQRNQVVRGASPRTLGIPVVWIERNIMFDSAAKAGSYFDCCATSIINHTRSGIPLNPGVTLRRIE